MARKRANGEGTIGKYGNGWRAVITLGRDAETGKLIRKAFYGNTQAEVKVKMNEALGNVRQGTYVEPTKQTVSEWLETWLNAYVKPAVKVTTFDSYSEQVRLYIRPRIGHIKLADLKTFHLQTMYNQLLENGRIRKILQRNDKGEIVKDENGNIVYKKTGLSVRNVRYIHVIINEALKQAQNERLITFNPATAAKQPKEEKKEMKVLDEKQIKDFLTVASERRLYAAYYLELSTGLRRGELLGLRWNSVDFKNNTIAVKEQLVNTKNGPVFQSPKSQKSKRKITVDSEAIKILKEHKKKQAEEILKAGSAYVKNDLVFPTEIGTPTSPRNFFRSFKAVLKAAGLPDIRFHDMRHTFSVLSLQAGIDVKTLQQDLGHHSAAFTLDVYGHITEKMKKEAAEKRGNILKGICNG